MPRKKLKHIQQCFTLPNVITEPSMLYNNSRDNITLEVGCGRGTYTLELGALYPQQQFFGIDRKPDRIWAAASSALEQNLSNASFIVSDVNQLGEFFPIQSISAIWLPFPDPQPKVKYAQRRLIALNYLLLYKSLLKPQGKVHFKTDNTALFIETQANIASLHGSIHYVSKNFSDEINTTYEQHYRSLGQPIYYLCFSF